MTDDRRRRPPLERTQPTRGWSTLLGADRTDARGLEGADPVVPMSDAVSKSVEIGYRVIDEYMQQGRRVAQRVGQGGVPPEVWTSEIQDLGARMARYASDLMATWMEFLELSARGGVFAPPSSDGTSPEAPAGGIQMPDPVASDSSPSLAGRHLRVIVRAAVATQVEFEYRPERVTGPRVQVHALRAMNAEKPRIADVSFQPPAGSDAPTLIIRVPPDQPPGTYEGLLVDEDTNRPVGSVRLAVLDPADDT